MKYEIGQIITITSPAYGVVNAKVQVYSVGGYAEHGYVSSVTILDDTIFSHSNFWAYHRHDLVDDDEVVGLFHSFSLDEDLFTL